MGSKKKAPVPRKKLQLPEAPGIALALSLTVPRERLDKQLKDLPENAPVRRAYAVHDAIKKALAPENRKRVIFEDRLREELKRGFGNPELAAKVAASGVDEFEELAQCAIENLPGNCIVLPGNGLEHGRPRFHHYSSRFGAELNIIDLEDAAMTFYGDGWRKWPGVYVDEATVIMWPPFTPDKIIAAMKTVQNLDRELEAQAARFNTSQKGGENKKDKKGLPARTIDAYLAAYPRAATFNDYFEALRGGLLLERIGVNTVRGDGNAVLFLNAQGHVEGRAASKASLQTTFRAAVKKVKKKARKPRHGWREK